MDLAEFFLSGFIWGFIALCAISSCLLILSYYFRGEQNRMLYYPMMPVDSTTICESPSDRGFFNSENVHIRTSDGVNLRGFIMWPTSDSQLQQSPSCAGRNTAPVSLASSANNNSAGFISAAAASATTINPTNINSGNYASQPLYTIIYFHGNAGNVGHRIPIAALLTSKLPCAVLMMDYRGFGLSDGVEPTEEGIKLDAQACLDFIWNHPRIPREKIFIMGTSLGGAVAIHLAAQPVNIRRIAGVIVENTFTSISDMVSALAGRVISHISPYCPTFTFLCFHYYIKPLCLRIGWRSIDLVQEIKAPMLFLSGLKDELVPPQQMKNLYAKASKVSQLRKFVEFAEGMHNSVPMLNGYTEAIDEFIHDVITSQTELV